MIKQATETELGADRPERKEYFLSKRKKVRSANHCGRGHWPEPPVKRIGVIYPLDAVYHCKRR